MPIRKPTADHILSEASSHPGMNVPCGMANGLPIGLMLVGERYDEAAVLRAAQAFEKLGDWTKM